MLHPDCLLHNQTCHMPGSCLVGGVKARGGTRGVRRHSKCWNVWAVQEEAVQCALTGQLRVLCPTTLCCSKGTHCIAAAVKVERARAA